MPKHVTMDEARIVHHALTAGQRAVDDVLVRVTYRDGRRGSLTQYASPGRAAYMLERYSRANFARNGALPCYVEKVNHGRIAR